MTTEEEKTPVESEKKHKDITVAKITTIGVVLAAIIGFLGILSTNYFGYLSDNEDISESIRPMTPVSATMTIRDSAIFTLSSAETEDFYTLENASFILQQNDELAITGTYGQGTYINQVLPTNFQVIVQFRTKHPDDGFILGISDGNTMRPNYHLAMNSNGTTFKQQLGFDVEEQWDKQIKTSLASACQIKPDTLYEVVFVREDGEIDISLNNNDKCTFSFNEQEVENINQFDFLYLTGAKNQQTIIESLTVESLE